jgi:hypothetical protein
LPHTRSTYDNYFDQHYSNPLWCQCARSVQICWTLMVFCLFFARFINGYWLPYLELPSNVNSIFGKPVQQNRIAFKYYQTYLTYFKRSKSYSNRILIWPIAFIDAFPVCRQFELFIGLPIPITVFKRTYSFPKISE